VTTTIIFVRHGSHDRLDRVLCGRMQGVGLSERGREEVRAAGRRLAREGVAALYSSPMARTRETADLLAAALGLPVETAEDLIELDYGDWTGATFEELHDDPRWDLWNRGRGVTRPPGGESMLEVQSRVRRFVEDVTRRHPDRRVAAVSHGDPIKAILAQALGMPLDNLARLEISPASISVLLSGDWGMKVFSVNEASR
jgi:probable phosphoglycerate mutase